MQMESRAQPSFGVYVSSEGQSTLAHELHSVGVQPNVSMVPSFVGFFTSLDPTLVSAERGYNFDSIALDAAANADIARGCDVSGTVHDGGKLGAFSLGQSASVGLPRQSRRSKHGEDPDLTGRRRDVHLGNAHAQSEELQLHWDDGPRLGSTETGLAEKTSEVATTQDPEPPPWSKLKTKAGKQRRRLPVACSSCRQRKVRCSGEEPTCKQCLRSRMSCVYKTRVRKTAPRSRTTMSSEERPSIKSEEAQSDAHVASNLMQQPPMDTSASLGSGGVKRTAQGALGPGQDSSRPGTTYDAGANMLQADHQQQALNIKLSMPLEETGTLPSDDSHRYASQIYYDGLQGQSHSLLHPPLLLPDGYFEQRSGDQVHPSDYGLGTAYAQAHSGGTTPSRRPSRDEGVNRQSFGGGHFDIHPSMLHPPLLWPPQLEFPTESEHQVPSHRGSFSQVDSTNVNSSLPPSVTNPFSHHDPHAPPAYGGSGNGMEGSSNAGSMSNMDWPPPFTMDLEAIRLWFEMHGHDPHWQQRWHFGDGTGTVQSTGQEPSAGRGHMPLHPPYLPPPGNDEPH